MCTRNCHGSTCYKQRREAILHTWFFRPKLYLGLLLLMVVILLIVMRNVRYWLSLSGWPNRCSRTSGSVVEGYDFPGIMKFRAQ